MDVWVDERMDVWCVSECVCVSYSLLHLAAAGQRVPAAVVDGDITSWKTRRRHQQ